MQVFVFNLLFEMASLVPTSVHLVRSRILMCGWHYMHTHLDRLLGDTLHYKLALVTVLSERVLQKVRGQIRSRLVLSPLSDAIKKKRKKKKIP